MDVIKDNVPDHYQLFLMNLGHVYLKNSSKNVYKKKNLKKSLRSGHALKKCMSTDHTCLMSFVSSGGSMTKCN